MGSGAQQHGFLAETRATAALSLPLIVGQLGQMLIGLTDTLMLGEVGVTELAACSLANALYYLPMMLAMGMSIAVSMQVSNARGALDPPRARATLRHGLYVTGVIGVLTALLAPMVLPLLTRSGQDPEVVAAMPGYFILLGASMVPAFATFAVKNFADAMDRPWPVFWVSLGGVGLNVLLNALLIFGLGPFPRLGLEGAGWATLVARLAALVGMIVWLRRDQRLREWVPRRWMRRPDWVALRRLLGTGWPASLQLLAEVSAFVAAALVIGAMGETALASHQIALQCAATLFMIPLGFSMATTVRIGEAVGAAQPGRLRPILLGSWGMGVVHALSTSLLLLLLNEQIASGFTDDPLTVRLAAGLLTITALFQFGDTIQVISVGALRGLDDVNRPALIAFLAYWVMALPLGWCLSHPLGLGVAGMWWGITAGLTLTAAVLGHRAWVKTTPPFPAPASTPGA